MDASSDPRIRRLLPLLGFAVHGDLGDVTMYTTRRRKRVMYPRSPPTSPPSPAQQRQRARFALAVTRYLALPAGTIAEWEALARRLHLIATGQNLWTHLALRWDERAWDVVVRRTGTALVPPLEVPR